MEMAARELRELFCLLLSPLSPPPNSQGGPPPSVTHWRWYLEQHKRIASGDVRIMMHEVVSNHHLYSNTRSIKGLTKGSLMYFHHCLAPFLSYLVP